MPNQIHNQLIPMVVDKTPYGERAFDVYSKLLQHRVVFLSGPIDDSVANTLIAQFLYLQFADPNKPISFYINSPGGIISSALAVYDTMQLIKPEVETICIGNAASAAAILLSSGTKGKRFALPNSEVVIHQPMTGAGIEGQATDVEIAAKHMMRLRNLMNNILAKNTGQPLTRIEKDTDRDFFMTAQEAKDYGVIDEIIGDSSEKKQKK
jgi:ATP-dependent Clp protease protease subunit